MSDAKEVTSFEDHPFPWREYHEHHDNTRSVFDSDNKFVGYFPMSVSRLVLARLNSYVEQQTRSAELAAAQKTIKGLKAVIANDTENEESAREIAAEVFGKEWANGDSYGVPNVVNFVERFRDELDAAQKTIAENKRAMREAMKAIKGLLSSSDSYESSDEEIEAAEALDSLTAALAAIGDGGGE